MKKTCPHCNKGKGLPSVMRWLNGVHAYWHDNCYEEAKRAIIEQTFPPRKRKKEQESVKARSRA